MLLAGACSAPAHSPPSTTRTTVSAAQVSRRTPATSAACADPSRPATRSPTSTAPPHRRIWGLPIGLVVGPAAMRCARGPCQRVVGRRRAVRVGQWGDHLRRGGGSPRRAARTRASSTRAATGRWIPGALPRSLICSTPPGSKVCRRSGWLPRYAPSSKAATKPTCAPPQPPPTSATTLCSSPSSPTRARARPSCHPISASTFLAQAVATLRG